MTVVDNEALARKLRILASSARYDASCASGTAGKRSAKKDGEGIGSLTGSTGICHSFTPDGRCVSLLKILLTNYCIYDCQYCMNRISSNIPRARFKEQEVIDLTLGFYKRNYIEGLFLSSGIIQTPDYTMEAMIRVARRLREEHGFSGYIHLKTIPNASPHLQVEAGWYADRLSINVELPTEASLARYAPEKDLTNITGTMSHLKERIDEANDEKRKITVITNAPKLLLPKRSTTRYVPGGQSTQMIIGADATPDTTILSTSAGLYKNYKLRRVYYSAFSPIPDASQLLPNRPAPLLREHRLYQADWLLRFYEFSLDDLLAATTGGMLDLQHDPKLSWALKNRHLFPMDLNTVDRHLLLRVPGLGVRSVDRILAIRRYHRLRWADLVKLRIKMDKVKPFVMVDDYRPHRLGLEDKALNDLLMPPPKQISLFDTMPEPPDSDERTGFPSRALSGVL